MLKSFVFAPLTSFSTFLLRSVRAFFCLSVCLFVCLFVWGGGGAWGEVVESFVFIQNGGE